MPEGPSIVILKDEVAHLVGRKILRVETNAELAVERLLGQRIVAFHSWGKQFLIQCSRDCIRIHFLLFGSYLIDARKPRIPRLGLTLSRSAELNFYACSVQFIDSRLDELYDWRADVMGDSWDARLAIRKLKAAPETLVCDALLDQTIFAGVGNIIKNEVLFRIRVHPSSHVGALPPTRLRALVEQARKYSFEFLEWKKACELKRHWLAHTRTICPRCDGPLIEAELGKTRRRTFFCERCQRLYKIGTRARGLSRTKIAGRTKARATRG